MRHSIEIHELIRLHHQSYQEDISFWISRTRIGSLILELGCGHGRVTIPLANAGRKVVGIDRDRDALSSLDSQRKTLPEEIRNRILIIQADILDFHSSSIFDAVILPCNTYSTFNHQDRLQLLSGVYRSLRSGGIFITSIPNPELGSILSRSLEEGKDEQNAELESQFIHPKTGLPVQVSSRLTPTQRGMTMEWIYDLLLPDGNVDRFVVSTEHYLESLKAYEDELIIAGFRSEAFLGDFSGTEYDQDSPFLIMVAKSF
jgi:SAM-dependent methyltransferase